MGKHKVSPQQTSRSYFHFFPRSPIFCDFAFHGGIPIPRGFWLNRVTYSHLGICGILRVQPYASLYQGLGLMSHFGDFEHHLHIFAGNLYPQYLGDVKHWDIETNPCICPIFNVGYTEVC